MFMILNDLICIVLKSTVCLPRGVHSVYNVRYVMIFFHPFAVSTDESMMAFKPSLEVWPYLNQGFLNSRILGWRECTNLDDFVDPAVLGKWWNFMHPFAVSTDAHRDGLFAFLGSLIQFLKNSYFRFRLNSFKPVWRPFADALGEWW